MKEEFGLKRETIEKLKNIFRKYPRIEKAILYGSRAKGNYKTGSDIDITLIAPQLNISDLMKIENEIDDLLLPYQVDLSLFHQIDNPNLIDHIQRIGKEFYNSSLANPI